MLKWVWKLFYRPQCIWARWVHAYVLKGGCFWDATQSISQFWYWNNVLKMKDLLLRIAGSPDQAIQLLQDCTSHMKYDTSAMYDIIRVRGTPVAWSSLVYNAGCHPKHSFIGMLVFQNGLPTVDRLVSRGIYLVNRCALCECCSEDLMHLFFACTYSRTVLMDIANWAHFSVTFVLLEAVLQDFISTRRSGKQRASLLALLYFLWKERNNRIFRGIQSSPETLCIVIKKVLNLRLYGL
ncbi:uncharacterized protein LOC141614129 [Silene latifolia]|uniref:uncharacterized protein LOC141614129 n=1 Tax=Silene latifolia TaxID=37657 RepID=UPI003D76D90E